VEITAGECSKLWICAERFAKNTPPNVVNKAPRIYSQTLSRAKIVRHIFSNCTNLLELTATDMPRTFVSTSADISQPEIDREFVEQNYRQH
jgi:hypothetical protein